MNLTKVIIIVAGTAVFSVLVGLAPIITFIAGLVGEIGQTLAGL